jgi:tetrahydromethanopterin S-methyltransferase subunit G
MRRFAIPALLVAAATGCNSLYYASMEKLGREKRDILVKRLIEGKKDQDDAKKQIQTTLEAFQELTGFEGGDLEKVYNKLNGELNDSKDKAKDLSNRIDSIDRVAKDMFAEWTREIGQMRDPRLKSSSRRLLRDTELRHRQLMLKMREVEERMEPVLSTFEDRVLFLKHNLNARAVGALAEELAAIETRVDDLVRELEASIGEAERFIATLGRD